MNDEEKRLDTDAVHCAGIAGRRACGPMAAEDAGPDFLTQTESINLSPAADLHVFRFDLTIGLELSLLSIIGAVLAVWLYRRM
ncbi:DUF4321 domain-containing protein [Paenibacillus cisolokensis]|nr:DUF4321 domain-containing protein [Paenibacillus cisolokensis]